MVAYQEPFPQNCSVDYLPLLLLDLSLLVSAQGQFVPVGGQMCTYLVGCNLEPCLGVVRNHLGYSVGYVYDDYPVSGAPNLEGITRRISKIEPSTANIK